MLQHRSLFLFGPRQTGKTTLLRTLFPDAKFYDLLEANTFRELSFNPELIRQRLTDRDELIVIDEIQKLPSLLDEVHTMMERRPALRFILTGSSARKLKRKGVNLLGGRAWTIDLHPLTSREVGEEKMEDLFRVGGLPRVFDSPAPEEDLKAYVGMYLQEEVKAEGLTRSIENFSRFLPAAALCNGEQVNLTEVGSDAGVPARTVREYFEILQDTLLGFMLPAFRKTKSRKAMAIEKFYLFDIGVQNFLVHRLNVHLQSDTFGRVLEHFIFLEIKSALSYLRKDTPLSFWRSTSKLEVDFLLDDAVAIEVKAKKRISASDCRGISALAEDIKLRKKLIVCLETEPRKLDNGIEVLSYRRFLDGLWSGEYF